MFIKKKAAAIGSVEKIGVYIGVAKLGDMLFIIPLFRALKKKYPRAETVFIGSLPALYVRPVFDNCPYIDRLFDYHFYEDKSVGAWMKFVNRMKGERFDIIMDTQKKFMPSLLLKMGGARFVVSYSSGGIFSDFTVEVKDKGRRHTADVSLDLARAIGISDPEIQLEIPLPEENKIYAGEFLREKGVGEDKMIAGLIPSAGFPTRCWSAAKFAQLAEKLFMELGCSVLCFGSHADEHVINEMLENVSTPVIVEDFSRKNILDSAALMARCKVIIGNDSGPLHVADAAGAPCVGIYGPTLPERFGLLNKDSKTLCLYAECSPCSDADCEHKKCIEDIKTEDVFRTVKEVLKWKD